MQGRNRVIAKIVLLVPLAIIASIFFLGPGGLISYKPATRASVHSLLALWISAPTVVTLLIYIRKPLRAHVILASAFIFPLVLHIGSAAKNLFVPYEELVDYSIKNATMDLFEFALTAFLILTASICYSRRKLIEQDTIAWYTIFGIVFIPSVLYGLFWFVFNFLVSPISVPIFGWLFAILVVVLFLLAFYYIPRIKVHDLVFDLGYLVSAIAILLVSSVFLLLAVSLTLDYWLIAESLQLAAYLLLGLSLCIPFLKGVGFRRRIAYGFHLGFMLLAYVPILATIVIESLSLNITIDPLNVLGFSVIHIGAGCVAGMMGLLLFMHSRRRPSWNYYPLILIFGLWATISIMQILMIATPTYNEPLISFTAGSLLTLILLLIGINWTLKPPDKNLGNVSFLRLTIPYAILVAFVVIGEFINRFVVDTYPILTGSPIGNTILLVSTLIILLILTFLTFLLASQARGNITIDLFLVFFLAMWLLSNILKSYYYYWSAGWWVSEILLFAGLLAGPPILAWLYIQEIFESESSRAKADLLADLLMHNITNYNQMILTSLELLGSDKIDKMSRVSVAKDGARVISFADQLISNVRLLSETERSKWTNLQPVNLVSVIVTSLDTFSQQGLSDRLVVEFKPETDNALVMANELLHHVFLNILYSALEYPKENQNVSVEIVHTSQAGTDWWETCLLIPGHWIRRGDSFHLLDADPQSTSGNILGLMVSRVMTQSLLGQFFIRDPILDNDVIKTPFVVRLLEVEKTAENGE